MRIVAISDTHYHPQWEKTLAQFVEQIKALQPDCVVHAGDVGEEVQGYVDMLTLLQALSCPRLILTGNHDLWGSPNNDSETLWAETLPALTAKYDAVWLEGTTWTANGIGVCGTNGWYDYSARDTTLQYSVEDYWRMKRYHIRDGDRVDWRWSDLEFAQMIGDRFSERLMSLEHDPTVRDIFVFTHVPVFQAAIKRTDRLHWNRSNAYFGNLTLGNRIKVASKVRRVISGHTHRGVSAQVDNIQMDVIPADYGAPAYIVVDC